MSDDLLGDISLAAPCRASWARMTGDDKVRFCWQFRKSVYNLSEMSKEEVVELIASTEGDFCGRLFRRPDGTIITNDCPVGIRLARRVGLVVAAKVSLVAGFILGIFGIYTNLSTSYQGHGGKIRVVSDKSNMHTMQLALESFATDSVGTYPLKASETLPYFPGGSNRIGGAVGNLPWQCRQIDVSPGAFSCAGGRPELNEAAVRSQIYYLDDSTYWIGYCALPDAAGKLTSYAVIGGQGNRIAKNGSGKSLVLSNQ